MGPENFTSLELVRCHSAGGTPLLPKWHFTPQAIPRLLHHIYELLRVAEITKILIKERGFSAIAAEAGACHLCCAADRHEIPPPNQLQQSNLQSCPYGCILLNGYCRISMHLPCSMITELLC